MNPRDDAERAVLAILREREPALVQLARELVAAPSPNPPGDERAAAAVAREALQDLGYASVRTLARAPERPNVVAEVRGATPGPTLMLNGHLDTKPSGNPAEWSTDPYDPVIRDGHLVGLGSADMKGAVAALIHAGGALAATGLARGAVRLVLSADEEAGSKFGAAYLAESGTLDADAALVAEPTGMDRPWEYVATASRGLSCFTIRVRGTQMHSSFSDRRPSVNASVGLARVLVRMADEFTVTSEAPLGSPDGPTVNLGVVLSGGVFFGVYPGEAEFGVDVRTVPGMTVEGLRRDVGDFLGRLRAADPGLDVAVEWSPALTWYPPSAIDADHELVRAAQSACRDVAGRDVPTGTMPAFTDGNYWCTAGIPTIPALGPGTLLVAHSPNERVAVDELLQAARIYALTAMRYLAVAAPTTRRRAVPG